MTEEVIANRYKILRRLGGGGMGSVFLSLDLKTNKEVVLKILNETLIGEGHNTQRFLDEGKKSKRLNHPNIVNVIDYGKDGNTYYIAMEYIRGSTVRDLIKKFKSSSSYIPLSLVKKILISTLYALAYARKNGIVAHRDIKSQNIMIDNKGIVKLLDFGNSKAVGFETYPTRWLTPEYEFPEQGFPMKFGNKIDIRSDIYSLGIVMYEMLTNRLPFTGSAAEVSEKHLKSIPPNPLMFRKDLPEGLVAIMYKALEKNPSKRYQTPEEMIRDLNKGCATNYKFSTASNASDEGVTVPSRRRLKLNADNMEKVSYASSNNPATFPGQLPKTNKFPLVMGIIVGIVLIASVFIFLPHNHSTVPVDSTSVTNQSSASSAILKLPTGANYIYPLSNGILYYTKDDVSSLSSSLYLYNGKTHKLVKQFPYLVSCFSVSGNGKYIAIVGGKDSAGFPQPVLHILTISGGSVYKTSASLGNVTFAEFYTNNEVLFTVLKSGGRSDIYLLDVNSKTLNPIVANGDDNLFPFPYGNKIYYIDRTKNSELMFKDLANGNISGMRLYGVSAFGIRSGEILYVDRDSGDIHLADISGSGVSGDKVIKCNKNGVTVIRIYPGANGFYLLQTKAGEYWIESIKE